MCIETVNKVYTDSTTGARQQEKEWRVSICAFALRCVCVCVRERERERERGGGGREETCVHVQCDLS